MTSILRGSAERGTAKKLKSLNVPLAGKTELLTIILMLGLLVFHQTW